MSGHVTPRVLRTASELLQASSELLAARSSAGADGKPGSLGFVPTMGALHEGHASLMRAARSSNTVVVASIFVNPLQFGEAADLDRYPRQLDTDLELLGREGVDLVFAPSVHEMYPGGMPLITLDSGPLGDLFEGAARPGHFNGMLTVVAKLLHCAAPAPNVAFRCYFGQKDAQQLALIRRMVADLDFRAEIVAVPTVRNSDGLALSSRNRFLSAAEADAALVLSRALLLLDGRARRQEPLDVPSAVALVTQQDLVELDYFAVVDPGTLEPLGENRLNAPFTGEALALLAARVGQVRLIDNIHLGQ